MYHNSNHRRALLAIYTHTLFKVAVAMKCRSFTTRNRKKREAIIFGYLECIKTLVLVQDLMLAILDQIAINFGCGHY